MSIIFCSSCFPFYEQIFLYVPWNTVFSFSLYHFYNTSHQTLKTNQKKRTEIAHNKNTTKTCFSKRAIQYISNEHELRCKRETKRTHHKQKWNSVENQHFRYSSFHKLFPSTASEIFFTNMFVVVVETAMAK